MNPLANATVTILGTSSTATTNDAGYYVMTNIPPGDYNVKSGINRLRARDSRGGDSPRPDLPQL